MTTTLITGATGTIGKQVATELLERNDHDVRVATRRPGAAADLAARGATEVVLDLDDPATFAAAFEDVDRLFLVGPQTTEHFGASVEPIVAAASKAGISFVVRLSALAAAPDASFAIAREHGIGERTIADSGLDFAILQPTFFTDNLINFQGAAITGQSAFYGASAGGKTPYIASADIARVAAAILTAPGGHSGKTYVLTGPEALADTEVAAALTDVLGKPIRYVDVPGTALEQSMLDNGSSAWMAASMRELEALKAAGQTADVSPAVEAITGRAPESVRAFLERNRARLS